MALSDEFSEFFGGEEFEQSVSTMAYFKENLEELEKCLKKAIGNRALKKKNITAYDAVATFIYHKHSVGTVGGQPLSSAQIGDCFMKARKFAKATVGKRKPVESGDREPGKAPNQDPAVVVLVEESKAVASGFKGFQEKSVDQLTAEGWDEDKAIDYLYDEFQVWRNSKSSWKWSQKMEDATGYYLKTVANLDTLKSCSYYDFKDNMKLGDLLRLLKENGKVN